MEGVVRQVEEKDVSGRSRSRGDPSGRTRGEDGRGYDHFTFVVEFWRVSWSTNREETVNRETRPK